MADLLIVHCTADKQWFNNSCLLPSADCTLAFFGLSLGVLWSGLGLLLLVPNDQRWLMRTGNGGVIGLPVIMIISVGQLEQTTTMPDAEQGWRTVSVPISIVLDLSVSTWYATTAGSNHSISELVRPIRIRSWSVQYQIIDLLPVGHRQWHVTIQQLGTNEDKMRWLLLRVCQ